MKRIVLKFGGSSVSNDKNLKIVANRIIELSKKYRIVVVVSAQGNTTDKLIQEAKRLDGNANKRELDSLISTGEQISASKLAILINKLGHKAISLNAYQVGIITNSKFQDAKIISIDNTRIEKELKNKKIVIVTGFQGIDKKRNITTLGRGGSDTSAVALAISIKAEKCYFFKDVDGVYTTDPKQNNYAVKINRINYNEMLKLSKKGAKILNYKCIQLARKYKMPIVVQSTFNNNKGTEIS